MSELPANPPFEHRVFRLTREDALAWLNRPRPLSGLGQKLALASILIPAFLLAFYEEAIVARIPAFADWTEISIGIAAFLTYLIAIWALGAFES